MLQYHIQVMPTDRPPSERRTEPGASYFIDRPADYRLIA